MGVWEMRIVFHIQVLNNRLIADAQYTPAHHQSEMLADCAGQ